MCRLNIAPSEFPSALSLLELQQCERNKDKITIIWKAHSKHQPNLPVSTALGNKPTPPCWGQSGTVPKEVLTIFAKLQEGFSPVVTSSG